MAMGKILGNLNYALAIGVVLLLAAMFGLHGEAMGQDGYAHWWLRFFHVIAGVLWIGLLYYFNFVQIPVMPKVPAELKGGVRSEEHTSELQSLMRISYAVFCLKKKKKKDK